MSNPNVEEQKFRARSKPRRCPNCKHSPLASILYGLYGHDEQLEKDIDDGRAVLGGCVIDLDDPAWRCVQCGLDIYKQQSGFS